MSKLNTLNTKLRTFDAWGYEIILGQAIAPTYKKHPSNGAVIHLAPMIVLIYTLDEHCNNVHKRGI